MQFVQIGGHGSCVAKVARPFSWRTCIRLILVASASLASIAGVAFAQPVKTSPATPSGAVTAIELVEARDLCCLAVASDGIHVAVRMSWQNVATNSSHARWMILRVSDGKVVGEVDAGETIFDENGAPAVEMPQWSADSAWLYFRALKGEEVQVWRVRADGSQRQQVTREASNVEAFMVGAGGGLTYAASGATRVEVKAAEEAELDTGVLLDQTIVPGLPVTRGFPLNGRMATYRIVSRPGPLARTYGELLGGRPVRFVTLDTPASKPRPADESVVKQFDDVWKSRLIPMFDPVGVSRTWSRDRKRRVGLIVSASHKDLGLPMTRSGQVLAIEDQTSGNLAAACSDPVCTDADQLWIPGWTQDDQLVVFQTVTFGRYGIHTWDSITGRVNTIVSQDAVLGAVGNGTVGACSLALEDIVCVSSAAATPPRLVAFGLKDHRQRVLFDPNTSLAASRLGRPEKIELKTKAGDQSYGWLILPFNATENARLPLVISSYTCSGFLLGGSGHDIPEHVLAGMGYAAICVDSSGPVVRRPPGSEWSTPEVRTRQMELWNDAVDVLAKRGLIDRNRVAVAGFSGSATGLAAGLARNDQFTAAIIGTGIGDDPIACYMLGRLNSCRNKSRQAGEKPPYDLRTGTRANAPSYNAGDIFTPLLMETSEEEHWTLMQLFTSLVDFDRTVEMHIYPGAYHYKNLPRQRLSVYARNIDWINFWLRGETAPEATKRVAYDRWGEMRDRQCQLFASRGNVPQSAWYCR